MQALLKQYLLYRNWNISILKYSIKPHSKSSIFNISAIGLQSKLYSTKLQSDISVVLLNVKKEVSGQVV